MDGGVRHWVGEVDVHVLIDARSERTVVIYKRYIGKCLVDEALDHMIKYRGVDVDPTAIQKSMDWCEPQISIKLCPTKIESEGEGRVYIYVVGGKRKIMGRFGCIASSLICCVSEHLQDS